MSVAAEEENVCQEILESWRERVKELIRGFEPADIWNQAETGTMWKGLPDKSLGERGKRFRGGKNSKERITAAKNNAAGGRENAMIIGRSKKTRCFANLPDISRPCGAEYFSNDKAWMKSDIVLNILTKLNNKLKRTDRHILLFLDNAPRNPPPPPTPTIKGMFSNIQIEFLPKNNTSRNIC